jgi:hypothetical protein
MAIIVRYNRFKVNGMSAIYFATIGGGERPALAGCSGL